jgi:hypothetical protein
MEEWALLDSVQQKLNRVVMVENFRISREWHKW